ncbi:MAG: hypothetical protein LBT62_02270 [Deltaproteobacteria bacterium]|nr:hypothetical protein [Deltaproteobacteria bacterium]
MSSLEGDEMFGRQGKVRKSRKNFDDKEKFKKQGKVQKSRKYSEGKEIFRRQGKVQKARKSLEGKEKLETKNLGPSTPLHTIARGKIVVFAKCCILT